MADVFISHLEWTGAAAGPTRDPATFSRDLNVSMDATALVAKAHESCFIANSVATSVDVVPAFAFVEAAASR